jgi:signal transduction histidine kinase
MFGTQRGEIIGNVCHKFICPAETGKCPITDLKQTIDNSERALLNNDGIKIPIIKSVVEITLGGRNLLLENFTDITEQKHTELIIQQQNKQLQELNSTKDKFFSIIAHDLKSPFLGFLGLTQTIAEDADKLSVKELVQLGSAMHQAADNLFKLLQNLLEWARLQSGSISLVPKDISLSDLIAENVETIKNSSEVKGISLNNIVTDRIHAYADEKMINSVLLNLYQMLLNLHPATERLQSALRKYKIK